MNLLLQIAIVIGSIYAAGLLIVGIDTVIGSFLLKRPLHKMFSKKSRDDLDEYTNKLIAFCRNKN